jgi:ABC-type nitrate/sulfonate/bicarbonate transport system substrate-binding protein
MVLAALAVLVFAGACGDDDDDSGDDSDGEVTATTSEAGGSATAASTEPEGSDDGELRDVTLMLNWVPNGQHSGVYIAKEEGYYEEAGLNVSIVEPSTSGVDKVVGNGQVEFGISVQESVIPARAAGVPVVSIAAILQHNDSSLVSLAEDGIESPKDLEGKTYGGFGGALETQLISALVQCDGGDPSTVNFTDVGNANYLAGMQDDRYDVVWVFEGWDALQYREIDKVEINSLEFRDYLDCIPDWYTPLFITSEQMIEENPDVVRAFVEATARGYEKAMEDPQLAADDIIANAPEIDETLIRLSTEYYADGRYVDEGRQWGLQDAEVWTTFNDFLVEAGLIDQAIDVDAAWTNDFMPEQE